MSDAYFGTINCAIPLCIYVIMLNIYTIALRKGWMIAIGVIVFIIFFICFISLGVCFFFACCCFKAFRKESQTRIVCKFLIKDSLITRDAKLCPFVATINEWGLDFTSRNFGLDHFKGYVHMSMQIMYTTA